MVINKQSITRAFFAVLLLLALSVCMWSAIQATTDEVIVTQSSKKIARKQPAATATTTSIAFASLTSILQVKDQYGQMQNVSGNELISFFDNLALTAEYGDKGYITKWMKPIRVQLFGKYTQHDSDLLAAQIEKLKLIKGMPTISMVDSKPNYSVYFLSEAEVYDQFPDFIPNSAGLCWVSYRKGAIEQVQAVILIDCMSNYDGVTLHEFAHGFGFVNDDKIDENTFYSKYYSSIFHDPSNAIVFADIDYYVFKLLYDPRIKPAMTKRTVDRIVKKLIVEFESLSLMEV